MMDWHIFVNVFGNGLLMSICNIYTYVDILTFGVLSCTFSCFLLLELGQVSMSSF